MEKNHAEFLRKAFNAYLAQLDAGGMEPTVDYLPYDFESQIDHYQWSLMGSYLVKNELQETTNILNYWHVLLCRWHAWNKVLKPYDQENAWSLRSEFLEPLVHHCLRSPSAVRDNLTFVATNAIHQLRISSEKDYKDFLEGDVIAEGMRPKHLTRAKKEERLWALLRPWSDGASFMKALQAIDDKFYRESTSDYRNRSSHSIGPRLGLGETQLVTRQVMPATRIRQQPNGMFFADSIPEKMVVVYGFGGTPPLDMEQCRQENLKQYLLARTTYTEYRATLASGMEKLPIAGQPLF